MEKDEIVFYKMGVFKEHEDLMFFNTHDNHGGNKWGFWVRNKVKTVGLNNSYNFM